MAESVTADPTLLSVDAAHYRLLEEVARGGVGRIVAAHDVRLDRDVALKMLHDPKSDPSRFVREALLTARLQHPSIIPVHEIGRFQTGEPFIAMKLVRGRSLRQEIRTAKTLAERLQLLPSVLAVTEAIAYAHSQRVIHRDLKPSNVLLGAFGETVVIDWGLAKHLDEADVITTSDPDASPAVDATRTGAVLGTPAYMAPEQACGDEVDERADVFALGAILYELFSGTPPFEGSSSAQVLALARRGAFPPLGERVPDLPVELAAIINRAMVLRVDERYRDASQLAADLRRYHVGHVVAVGRGKGDNGNDPVVETSFAVEVSRRAVAPVRITSALAIVALPITSAVQITVTGPIGKGQILWRSLAVVIAAALLALSYSERARRRADVLAIALIALIGAMACSVSLPGSVIDFAAATAAVVMVILSSSTMFQLPPLRMGMLLVAINIGFLVTSACFDSRPAPGRLLMQLTLFSFATTIAIIGARIHFRLLRAEFYSRHRLEEANRRLAQLDRPR